MAQQDDEKRDPDLPEEDDSGKRGSLGKFSLHGSGGRDVAPMGTTWFLGIGINHYQDFTDLSNAVKDLDDIVKLLSKSYGLDIKNTKLLLNEEATRDNIILEFRKLVKKIEQKDRLIIYYSGHGHLDTLTDSGYWIPSDGKKGNTSRYVSNDDVRRYVKSIKSLHTLIISDSCFSGALFVRGSRSSDLAVDELEARPSRWAICSGRHDEEVADGEPGENSPFAASILDVLGSNRLPKFNVAKLADRAIDLTRRNYTQLPEGSAMFNVGDKGGQFVFRLEASEANIWEQCSKGNTITAYAAYLTQFPKGEHAGQAEDNIWKLCERENKVSSFTNYLGIFPVGKYEEEALNNIKELEGKATWKKAKRSDSVYSYLNYIRRYPDGQHVNEAREKIRQLEEPVAATPAYTPPEKKEIPKKEETPKKKETPRKEETPKKEEKPRESKTPVKPPKEKPEQSKKRLPFIILGGLVLLILGVWGVSKVVSGAGGKQPVEQTTTPEEEGKDPAKVVVDAPGKETKKEEPKGKPEEEVQLPPTISSRFQGEELKVSVSKGTPPYVIKLIRRGKEKYSKNLSRAGDLKITLTEYRKEPGTYIIRVEDANKQSSEEDIRIDAPKVPKVQVTKGSVTLKGQTYQTVRINNLTWMAENLNYEIKGSSWCYDDNPSNCDKYGRLYTWEAAKKACRDVGWRLPTDGEWRALLYSYGDGGKAYEALTKGGNSGFNALMGGVRSPDDGSFGDRGGHGGYFSSTENNARDVWNFSFSPYYRKVGRYLTAKSVGRSCWCVKD